MITIKELFNKIRWDPYEIPTDYNFVFHYYDRVKDRLIELPYLNILRLEGTFFILNDVDETMIPSHRVKKVTKMGEIIWERN
ncbi:DUF504 domain-containing protein [Oceanihabitans sediminis]|uniref:DUF504 domain-containing protein n=1 Tax=Oceanihabitans sediminis TaxID=1812012 RepID=UPI0038508860